MSVSRKTYGHYGVLRPLALSAAMVLGIAICRADGVAEDMASGTGSGMGDTAILRDWEKDSIASIEYSANKRDGQRVMLLGYVAETQASDATMGDAYMLMGYGKGSILVQSYGRRPMPNDDVLLLGIVHVDLGDPYERIFVSEIGRFDVDREQVRDWANHSELFAIENCFRTRVCVNDAGQVLPPISVGDYFERGKRTTKAELDKHLEAGKTVAQP
ncbi:MAG: hypothetical protein ACOX5G_14145 [Kiritimatiellia bacterium]|jgi:hypothetical protein